MAISEFFISAGDSLNKVAKSLDEIKPCEITGVVRAVAKQMEQPVRAELRASYRSSGLKIDSDTLFRATASEARVVVTPRGIYIGMGNVKYPSGKGNVYAAAASHKFGSVRGPREHMAVRDTVSGKVTRHETRSVLGARAKRSIKKGALSKRAADSLKAGVDGRNVKRRGVELGEVTVVPPAPGFFELKSDQVDKLAAQLARLMEQELLTRGFVSAGGKKAA
jgi:hypothetical protein